MYMDSVTPACGKQIDIHALARFSDLDAIEAAIVRAIVRGEQSADSLKDTTIRIDAHRVWRTFGEREMVFLTVQSRDLAEGLINLKDDPAALADWARFILLTTEFFRFEDRQSEFCDRLIGAAWEIAFGAPLGEATLRLAQSVRHRANAR